MPDQASQLRQLAQNSQNNNGVDRSTTPRMIVFVGGCARVGTTTLTIHLATAWGKMGQQLVLVDAHPTRGEISQRCATPAKLNISDVMSARQTIREVLERGPSGVRIVPGRNDSATNHSKDEGTQSRLFEQLATLDHHTDAVLVDAGHSASDAMRAWWQAADEIVVISTPEVNSVLNAYAIIKSLGESAHHAALRLVVNRAQSADHARDVHRRISQSCQRFLRRDVQLLGHVPTSSEFARVAALTSLSPSVARELDQMAAVLANDAVKMSRTSKRLAA